MGSEKLSWEIEGQLIGNLMIMTAAMRGSSPPTLLPQKSFLTTWLFALLLGVFGADRFYLEKHVTAVIKLLTLGGSVFGSSST